MPGRRDREPPNRLAEAAGAIAGRRGLGIGFGCARWVRRGVGVQDLHAGGGERDGVGLAQASRPDQAGDLAVAVSDCGVRANSELVEPAKRGQRPGQGTGLIGWHVIAGAGGGVGQQQRDAAIRVVGRVDSRPRREQAIGQAGQHRRALAGQPGELLLVRGDDRQPHRSLGRGVARELDREVAELCVGQPRCDVGDPGQDRGQGIAVRGVQQVCGGLGRAVGRQHWGRGRPGLRLPGS